MRPRSAIAPLLLFLAACPHSDDPQLQPIVGRWRALPGDFVVDPPPISEREVVTFGADGSFRSVQPGFTTTGTYSVDSGRLEVTISIEPPSTIIRDLDYTRFNDRLLILAMRPMGPLDGVVGTWRGVVFTTEDSFLQEERHTLELRGNGTGTYTRETVGSSSVERDGTWRMQGETVRLDDFEGTADFGMVAGALAPFPYELID